MPDVEPVIDDELGDVRRLIELAENAAVIMEHDAGGSTSLTEEIAKVAARLKGRL